MSKNNEDFTVFLVGSLTKAITYIISLAWNDAVRSFQEDLKEKYPELKNRGPWVYAFIVTLFSFFVLLALHKVKTKFSKKN